MNEQNKESKDLLPSVESLNKNKDVNSNQVQSQSKRHPFLYSIKNAFRIITKPFTFVYDSIVILTIPKSEREKLYRECIQEAKMNVRKEDVKTRKNKLDIVRDDGRTTVEKVRGLE